MTQKILAGRADDPSLAGELVRVKVDQVVLSRAPDRTLEIALASGLKRAAPELAVAYDGHCITTPHDEERGAAMREALGAGLLVARPGIGFAAPVHLERFASPARLAVTDDPRLAAAGGAGLFTLTLSPTQLAESLLTGSVWLRPPRSVEVLLSGRLRPFVSIRDVALELLRRGLREVVERVDRQHQAPVVLEFTGPSARLLAVPERAILCALAPRVGAAAALFTSDEKTEVYLRDQRRSKAHRGLLPDPGAPCEEVVSLDLSAVDPLAMEADGAIRSVRELADLPVTQAVLGGDTGASLRDLLSAAALLKSKRVPPKLDFLLAPPSRQSLEVLAQCGALVDLVATGARLLEPDSRILNGELYSAPANGLSLRTFEADAGFAPVEASAGRPIVVSPETLAFAVATGTVGDPRGFKRPVRITVPRALPTDDVLMLRKGKGAARPDAKPLPSPKPKIDPKAKPETRTQEAAPEAPAVAAVLTLVAKAHAGGTPGNGGGPSALVCESVDRVMWAASRASSLSPSVKAVIASHIPSAMVPVFSGLGILALTTDANDLAKLRAQTALELPHPERWNGDGIQAKAGTEQITLRWIAIGRERDWARAAPRAETG
jgi:aconitate hydratase